MQNSQRNRYRPEDHLKLKQWAEQCRPVSHKTLYQETTKGQTDTLLIAL